MLRSSASREFTGAPEPRPPTVRLLAGLAFTLLIIGIYAAFTLSSVQRMRAMQTDILERNRLATLQLLRIQNELHGLGLALRDIVENPEGYPVVAWRPALTRMRENLDDALRREAELAGTSRPQTQTAYLKSSFEDFWRATPALFTEARAADYVRHTLQPRQEALAALTARLLVENSARDSEAGQEVARIFSEIERNAYGFLAVSVVLIAVTSLGLIRANRRLFARVAALAEARQGLARQLIATQEATLRSLSRDLHDEFGQILTGVGALLRRARRHAPPGKFEEGLQEVNEVVQQTLDKIRTLSQTLQPVILEEQGLAAAIDWQLLQFERHTGIHVERRLRAEAISLPPEKAIHVYRILQECLNNVARHAGVDRVTVAVEEADGELRIEVADAGGGMGPAAGPSLGLSAMRERAGLLGGELSVESQAGAGTRVRLRVRLAEDGDGESAKREVFRG